jgi:hypothetical protein
LTTKIQKGYLLTCAGQAAPPRNSRGDPMTTTIPENTTTRRKPGRPPVESAPVTVRLTTADIARVDDWRRGEHDLPSRPEGIRRLIELGFRAGSPRDTAA